MNPNNPANIPYQNYPLTNQEHMLKAPDHSNSSRKNEVYSIISSVTNDINSKWNPASLMSPPSFGTTTGTRARAEATSSLFERRMPALTNCVCQNDMNVASPNSGPQTTEQMPTGSRPQTNFSFGANGMGAYMNTTPSDSGWPRSNLSLTSGRPFTNSINGITKSTITGDGHHAILSSISGTPSPKSVHAVTTSTSISGNPHAKPPLYPVRRHSNPVAGIHVQASTSAGYHTNPTGPSPNANWTNYRAGGVQPPANSLHPNISGNNSMGFSAASVSMRIPKTQSNQNSMLAQDMRQLQQPLQPSPTCQRNTVAVGGICAQKLQQYLSDWNSRPTDNNILFWRSFVAKYYADNSKRRLCSSTCKHKSSTSLQHLQEKWQCVFCKEFSDKSNETSFDKMAERFQTNFKSYTRLLLSFGPCKETKLTTGGSAIFYKKVVKHAMTQSRSTIYEGSLLVTFNTELKISQWDFCMCRSEELISRTVLGSQMDEFLQAAKKYEESPGGNESGGDRQLFNKALQLSRVFIKSGTFQIPQGIASMNSTQKRINLTESLNKSNPTSDPMPECGNPNMNPNPLKRSFTDIGLERNPHPRQQASRQRLEASTSNNDSNCNASANRETSTSNNRSNINASANMVTSTSNNDSNKNASANSTKEELFRKKHHEWYEGMVVKILDAKSVNELLALIAS